MTNIGFIKLGRELLQSEDFVALSANAKALFVGVAGRFNGRNNGSIPFGVREAERWLHCGRATACRVFKELEAAGFIEAVERGAFNLKAEAGQGKSTRWRITTF